MTDAPELLEQVRKAVKLVRSTQTQTNEGQTESIADNHSFIHRLAGALLDGGVTIVPTTVLIKDQFVIVDYLLTYEDEQLYTQSAGHSMMEALTDLLRTLSGSVTMGSPSGTGVSQENRGFPAEQGPQAGVRRHHQLILQGPQSRP